MIVFDAGVFTDCGFFRDKNEDSFSLCGKTLPEDKRKGHYYISVKNQTYGVAAVFDGMGGERYGEIASGGAAGMLSGYSADILNFGPSGVNRFAGEANGEICKKAFELSAPMGSTMVLAAVSDEQAAVFNIGDSRAYIFRNGQIKQATKDHTVAANLSSMGMKESGKSARHQLTQYLGIPPDEIVVKAFTLGSFKLYPGDKILLCSDGITDGLSETHILSLLSQEKTAEELAREITEAAIIEGSRDNVTSIVLTFFDDGKPSQIKSSGFRESFAAKPKQNNKAGLEAVPPRESSRPSGGPRHLAPAGRPLNPPKKEKTGVYRAVNIFLALLLGFILGIIYHLLTHSL